MTAPDQILPSGQPQGFANQRLVLRMTVLHQGTLKRLVLRGASNKDGLHGARIKTGIEHAGGQRTGRRIEVLYLIGIESRIAQVASQLYGCV